MKLIANRAGENVPNVPRPITLRMIVVISAANGNSSSTHHLVHRDRQPREVENLDRVALSGPEHGERRLDADDRIFGRDFRGRSDRRGPADRRRGGRGRSSSADSG